MTIQTLIRDNDVEGLRKILREQPELLNEKINGFPPLVYVINNLIGSDPKSDEIEKKLQIVRVLLECGTDVNTTETYQGGPILYDSLNYDYQKASLYPGAIHSTRMHMPYMGQYDEVSVKLLHEKVRTLLKEFNAISYIEETEKEVKSQYEQWDALEKQKKINPQQVTEIQDPIVVPASPFQVITVQDEAEFLATKNQYEEKHYIFFKNVNWQQDYPRAIWVLPKDSLKKETSDSPEESALAARKRLTWDLANIKNQTLIARKEKIPTGMLGSTPLERVIDLSSGEEDYAFFVKAVPFTDIPKYLGKDSPLESKTHDHFSLATPHFSGMSGLQPLLIFKVPAKAVLTAYSGDATLPTFYSGHQEQVWRLLYLNLNDPESKKQTALQLAEVENNIPKTTLQVAAPLFDRKTSTLEKMVRDTREVHNEVVVLGNSFLSDKDKVQVIGLGFSKGELDYFNGISPDQESLKQTMRKSKFSDLPREQQTQMIEAIDFFKHNTNLPIVLLRDKRFAFTESMTLTDKAAWLLAERAYFLASLIKIKAVEKVSKDNLSPELQESLEETIKNIQDIDKQLTLMTEELEHGKKTIEINPSAPTLEFSNRGVLGSSQKPEPDTPSSSARLNQKS